VAGFSPEALVVIAGVEQKAHFQCFDLP